MAELFRKFNEIDEDYIHTDKHIHSNWTDGKGSISAIFKEAQRLGLKQIAITEHVRRDSKFFTEYCREIDDIKQKCDIDVLEGFEAKISGFDGKLDVSKEIFDKAKLKIGSVHRFTIGRRLYPPGTFEKVICQEIELELSIAAIQNGECDVLGHPGGMSLISYGEFPLGFFKEIILECNNNGIAFEINNSYHKVVFKDLKKLLNEYNPLVSIGSDAHNLQQIGSSIELFENFKDE